MAFGWCCDERPYPEEEIEDLRIQFAKLIEIVNKMAETLAQLPRSRTRAAWCERTVGAGQEVKGDD